MSEYTTQTLRHGTATIIIHRPKLSDDERHRREELVRGHLTNAMRDYYKRKEMIKHEDSGGL